MKDVIDKCAAALKKVEWVLTYTGGDDELKCPACGAWKVDGHKASCIVRDALATLRKNYQIQTR